MIFYEMIFLGLIRQTKKYLKIKNVVCNCKDQNANKNMKLQI